MVVVKNGGLPCKNGILAAPNWPKWAKKTKNCDFLRKSSPTSSGASKGNPEVIFYIPGMCAFKNDPRGQLSKPGECRVLISKAIIVDFLVFFGVLGPQLVPRQNLQIQCKPPFLTTTKIWTCPKNKNIFRFKKNRGPFLNGHIRNRYKRPKKKSRPALREIT